MSLPLTDSGGITYQEALARFQLAMDGLFRRIPPSRATPEQVAAIRRLYELGDIGAARWLALEVIKGHATAD